MVLQGCVHRITVDVVVVQGREGRCVFISHLPAGVRVCKEWEAEKYRKEWSTKKTGRSRKETAEEANAGRNLGILESRDLELISL